jgi:hypothetical protein
MEYIAVAVVSEDEPFQYKTLLYYGNLATSPQQIRISRTSYTFSRYFDCILSFLPLGVASCCASIQLVLYDAVNRNKVSIR